MVEKGTFERTNATGLLVASAIFFVLGAYGVAFSALYDLGLIPLIALSVILIATGLAAFFARRLALWLALLLFPVGVVQVLSALSYSVTVSGWYSNNAVTLFNTSLILYVAGLVISLLLIIDKRSQLK